MDLETYQPKLKYRSNSVISGEIESEIEHSDPIFNSIPVLKAFIEDNDLQEITVTSTNIGFVKTFRKQFKPMNR